MRFNFSSAFERQLEDDSDSVESVTPGPRRSLERSAGTSFASPHTSQSSVTTGGVGVSPAGLIQVENTNQICGGVVGDRSQGRFCTLPAGLCVHKKHSENKVDLQDDRWHIVWSSGRRPSALVSPNIPASFVTRAEDITSFKTEQRDVEVWRAYFTSLRASHDVMVVDTDGESYDVVSAIESPTAAQFCTAADELNTPRNVVLGNAVKSASEGSVNVPVLEKVRDIGYDEGLPKGQDWDVALGTVVAEWSKVGSNFEKLKTMFSALGEEHTRLGESVLQDLLDVESKAKMIDNKILLLKERIGQDSKASDGGAKTVWDAISDLQTSCKEIVSASDSLNDQFKALSKEVVLLSGTTANVNKRMDNFEVDYQASMESLDIVLRQLRQKVDNQGKGRSKFSQGRTKSFQFGIDNEDGLPSVRARVRDLEDVVAELKDLASATGKGPLRFGEDLHNLGTKVDRMSSKPSNTERLRAQRWEGGFGSFAQFSSAENERPSEGFPSSEGNAYVEEVISHIQSEIEFLQGKVKGLETPHRGESVEVNGTKINSLEDCQAFLRKTKLDVGGCTDLLSSLIIMGSKDLTGKERADELYSAQRIDTSVRCSDLMASMRRSRPEKLYAKGGKGDLVPVSEGFGAISSHKEWHGTGVDGVKATLTTDLRSHLTGLRGSLQGQHGEGPELARALTRQVSNQWNDFTNFLEQAYIKLVEVAKFSPKAAWKLIGRYGVAFFEAMRPYRDPATLLEHADTLSDQATLLWAVLQCHRVAEEFITLNFEGHPAIVREMSLFMLTERVDPVQFTQLLEQNKELIKESNAQGKRIKSLEDTANTLKRTLDNLNNEVKQMKKTKS
mmetsp:Transcript_18233/g.45138  ORF Transcript_18233/g.45138 Transcript_18233/m.45138 type:complete len:843 (-) Transcript_18233:6186-8714(-)